MNTPIWHGALDASALRRPAVADGTRLADAAKAGHWNLVFELLKADVESSVTVNSWRPGGTSWYAPLHQAAWHGATADVVQKLLDLGAWRSLSTAKGQRPVDIAVEKGHRHLVHLLTPQPARFIDPLVASRLEAQLAVLVESRVRPQLDLRLRHPSIDVLAELPGGAIWYPVPGMHGGFSISLREHHLYVESWSRVVDGSGQAHLVTQLGPVLVNEGFV